jgi:uncharacterized protein YdaT
MQTAFQHKLYRELGRTEVSKAIDAADFVLKEGYTP